MKKQNRRHRQKIMNILVQVLANQMLKVLANQMMKVLGLMELLVKKIMTRVGSQPPGQAGALDRLLVIKTK